jgi:hypothetical protein
MQEKKNQPYRAYLLRCWQEGKATPSQAPPWRFYVEEILPGRHPKKGFSNLGALCAFLQAELASSEAEPSEDRRPMIDNNTH